MIRLSSRALIGSLLALALVGPSTSLALVPNGLTVYVDDDGTAGADSCTGDTVVPTSIQVAVDSVGQDSTVLVCPGSYTGAIAFSGSGHDGLTIRGVTPWTATIRPTTELGLADNLVEIDHVDRLTIQHLRFVIPATPSPCTKLGDVLQIDEARKLRVLSNRIIAKGPATAKCGFGRGMYLEDVTATVSWNLVQDFAGAGISICGSWGRTRVYRNSIRFFHASEPSIVLGGEGILVSCNIAPGPYEVLSNVIRSLPTAGVTTPRLARGIDSECCSRRIAGNRVSGALYGIDINEREFDTVIEDNTVVEGDSIDGIGVEISGDMALTVRNNTVNGHAKGVRIVDGGGHTISGNDLVGNFVADCLDETTGSGTGGTANTWSDNLAVLSSPAAICPASS